MAEREAHRIPCGRVERDVGACDLNEGGVDQDVEHQRRVVHKARGHCPEQMDHAGVDALPQHNHRVLDLLRF